jgi:peptide-methionine (S)-S-oxide reductase
MSIFTMSIRSLVHLRWLIGSLAIGSLGAAVLAASQAKLPDPAPEIATTPVKGKQTAVLAGGCFWGVEAVFEHVQGVSEVISGFAGGSATTAHYAMVSGGNTGHAEAVKITYDPTKISYGKLLKIYFSVAHDPTQFNRQGPDHGTQYRSAIFFANSEQQRIAQSYIAQLTKAHVFPKPIVTQVVPLKGFFAAEADHQNFIARNPSYPYVVVHDLPKLAQLKVQFASLYKQ